jgi:hypothetical protein
MTEIPRSRGGVSAVAKGTPVQAVPKLVSILAHMTSEDRRRAVQAALMIIGEDNIELPGGRGDRGGAAGSGGGESGGGGGGGQRTGDGPITEQAYFQAKAPKGKVEELAVAARYREEHASANASSRADIQAVVTKARRNFDANNFNRDITRARGQRLFTTGSSRDSYQLSDYGQQYVDMLPDREAVKKLAGGKKRGGAKEEGGQALNDGPQDRLLGHSGEPANGIVGGFRSDHAQLPGAALGAVRTQRGQAL